MTTKRGSWLGSLLMGAVGGAVALALRERLLIKQTLEDTEVTEKLQASFQEVKTKWSEAVSSFSRRMETMKQATEAQLEKATSAVGDVTPPVAKNPEIPPVATLETSGTPASPVVTATLSDTGPGEPVTVPPTTDPQTP